MKKKILVFTNHFYPERFRINDIATFLDSQNFEVEVVTQLPNYPNGVVYPGFKSKTERSVNFGNVKVNRLWCIPRGKNSLGLMINYLTYWFSSFIFSIKNKGTYDYVFIYQTSPIFMAKAAQRVAKKSGARVVHYILDMWPDNLIATLKTKNPIVISFFEKMCLKIYKKSDDIIVSSKMFIKQLAKLGLSKDVFYLPQHAESIYEFIEKPLVNSYLPQDKFNLVFTGNIGEAQGLDFLIEVARRLSEDNNKHIHINLVGDGRYLSTLKYLVEVNNLNEIFSFHGSFDITHMSKILSETDLGLISFTDDLIYQFTVPAKLQSYLACGVPIITFAKGEVNQIVSESNTGIAVELGDVDTFVEELLSFSNLTSDARAKYKENALKYFNENFSSEIVFRRLLKYFGGDKL